VPPPSPALEIRFPVPPSDPDLADRLAACLDDYHPVAIDEGAYAPDAADAPPARWLVHFADPRARDDAAAAVGRAFAADGLVLAALEVPDGAWAERSQAALPAVRVGDLVVAPPWDVPDAPAASVVVITPSTGFGTGHHATTRMCLLALQQIDLSGRSAVDVGTGSGLLAIAASRLGASRVLAMDDDSSAFHAAQDNLTLNRAADVSLRLVDIRSVTLEPFDVVMANLTAPLIREAASRLADLTAPGGHLILSGFMTTEEADVLGAFGGFTPKARTEEEEWVCVTLQRP